MIEKIEELGIKRGIALEELDQAFQEKLGVSLAAMTEALQLYVQERAEELAANFLVMVPNGDYARLLEDQVKMIKFLREEASQPDNWLPNLLKPLEDPKQPSMLKIVFDNTAVDDGDSLVGFVFVSFAGKILHAFVQGDP